MADPNNLTDSIPIVRRFREKLLADPHRPGYHFAIPEDMGIPGDPNGCFFAHGRYHFMYLYKCCSDGFRWGHVSSLDLVHWRSHPDALAPDEKDGGIYSGGAFVDDDGTAYLTYWSLPVPGNAGGVRIARSCDNLYEKWEKFKQYALVSTEFGLIQNKCQNGNINYIGCSDPSNIWKKKGKYYMQTGNLPILLKFKDQDLPVPENVRGDWVDLFESVDIMNWQYVHRFYQRDTANTWTGASDDDMCPVFLPLPASKDGGEASGKYLQLFLTHAKGCSYYTGVYDTSNDLFLPENYGRMSWADNAYFAPEALCDDRGRCVMWAWLNDNPDDDISRGWSGVYAMPRLLWLNKGDSLGIAPADECKKLRYQARMYGSMIIGHNCRYQLDGVNGESCEIKLSINMKKAGRAGILVRACPDESTATYIYYNAGEKQLVMDTTSGTIKGRPIKESAPLTLGKDENLEMTVYVDKSVIEVFANQRQAICRRVYPDGSSYDTVKLFCDGGEALFEEIMAWDMMPSNYY